MINTEHLFFSITEASRLTGIDKKGIYNRANKDLEIINSARHGRKFAEMLISFDDVCKLSPAFDSLYLSRVIRLFTLFGETGLAFRVNEVTWLLGLSNQWVFKQIKEGTVPVFSGRREHRAKAEKLILAQDLRKIKSEPMNIKDKVFELFTLKKTNG